MIVPALALTAFATSAFARQAPPGQLQASEFAEEELEEEWEGEEPEGDGGWVELEGEEEGEEAASRFPLGCLLRTAQPEAVLDASHEELRLRLRYTARIPAKVGVASWLTGGKGSLQLGSTKSRAQRAGVLRLNRHLDPRSLIKARAARIVFVRLGLPTAPGFCRPYLTIQLGHKRLVGERATWSESR